jgi:hypothetical protein
MKLPGGRRARRLAAVAAVGAVAVLATACVPPVQWHGTNPAVLTRNGADIVRAFRVDGPGEVLGRITARAPGVSWASTDATSAVVQVFVDGKYVTDDVVMSSRSTTREFDFGTLTAGRHELRLHFDTNASPPGATSVEVERFRARTIALDAPEYAAISHAPVLYGRNLTRASGPSGRFQNAVTDTPLVAWHEETPASTPGQRHLEYSIVWSNEDGGTSTPALMARWGRTTDIEWIYRVDVDADGNTVPGTAVFQAPLHGTVAFNGTYEGDHPLLQTCTLNNNVCDTVDDPMRFALSTAATLDASTHAREEVMDANPWTYHVMADEVRREGKVVANPDAAQAVSIADPRDYLYVVVRKHTLGPNNGTFWVGVTIGVKLKGDPTLYRSDRGVHPDWSLQRDDPAATTVLLPPGTQPADIAEIDAIRVPFGPDTGVDVQVDAVNRAFFLGRADRPHASFLSGATPATLTAAAPTAVLSTNPAG